MARGGRRSGAGRKPVDGVTRSTEIRLLASTGEAYEITSAIPVGTSRSRWIIESALMRARANRA